MQRRSEEQQRSETVDRNARTSIQFPSHHPFHSIHPIQHQHSTDRSSEQSDARDPRDGRERRPDHSWSSITHTRQIEERARERRAFGLLLSRSDPLLRLCAVLLPVLQSTFVRCFVQVGVLRHDGEGDCSATEEERDDKEREHTRRTEATGQGRQAAQRTQRRARRRNVLDCTRQQDTQFKTTATAHYIASIMHAVDGDLCLFPRVYGASECNYTQFSGVISLIDCM